MLRGVETTQHVFANVEYDIDPLVYHSNSEVHHLETIRQVSFCVFVAVPYQAAYLAHVALRQLHEAYAHRVHLDFLRGMFIQVVLFSVCVCLC